MYSVVSGGEFLVIRAPSNAQIQGQEMVPAVKAARVGLSDTVHVAAPGELPARTRMPSFHGQ